MINSIKDFFSTKIEHQEGGHTPAKEKLAAAALLIEVIQADNHYDESEKQALNLLLEEQYQIPKNEIEQMVTLAKKEVNNATSMYQFTSLINEHFSIPEKNTLIFNLWRIAYADQHLDKHEEYVVRKIADLIHVRHSDFMRTKSKAKKLLSLGED